MDVQMREVIVAFNYAGNHYVRRGALGYVIFMTGSDTLYGTVKTRSGRSIERWFSIKDLYNFRKKDILSNLKANHYSDDHADDIIKRCRSISEVHDDRT
mgnify:CR=1 FL=1